MNSLEKEREAKESTTEDQIIDFDVVLKHIGSCGKYQLALVLLAYYICIPCGMHQVGAVFLAAVPVHRCWIPGVDGNPSYSNMSEKQILNATIPYDDGKYRSCYRYDYNLSTCTNGTFDCLSTANPRTNTIACEDYYYDTSMYKSTVTTEWDLVCDRLTIGTTATAMFYCGVLISAVVGGNIADIFGRVPTMVVGQMCLMAVSIGCAFSPNLYAFAATRFMLALFLMASYVAAFVYVVEITSGKWRTMAGINIQAAFAVGYMILSGLAYQWRDWRHLQFGISLVSLPVALLWLLIPESPRWLFTKGMVEKGKDVSTDMAKKNGKELPSNIWETASTKESKDVGKRYSPLVLFRRPRMRLLTLNVVFIWFVISLVYYGLSLNIGSLAGDDYVNNTLSGLVELISFPIVIYTLDKFGRRPTLSISLLFGGVCCLGSTLANLYAEGDPGVEALGTVLGLLGKLAVSGAFAIIFNYTAELYPTVVRSTAVGTGSMVARVGSIFTPYTLQLQYTLPWLTGTIFGVLSLMAGCTCLFLPETMGTPMLTSLDEAERFYAHHKYRETLTRDVDSAELIEGYKREKNGNTSVTDTML